MKRGEGHLYAPTRRSRNGEFERKKNAQPSQCQGSAVHQMMWIFFRSALESGEQKSVFPGGMLSFLLRFFY